MMSEPIDPTLIEATLRAVDSIEHLVQGREGKPDYVATATREELIAVNGVLAGMLLAAIFEKAASTGIGLDQFVATLRQNVESRAAGNN
jgi:hypothetical protein